MVDDEPTDQPGCPMPERAVAPQGREKTRLTVRLPVDVLERLRDASYWSRVPIASLAEAALTKLLQRLEQGRGKPYPPRAGDLRPGRPIQ